MNLVIIGAPRSGTNILRDVLCSASGCVTWPCDEINPIWRYRNCDYPYDDLSTSKATPEIRTYINRQFRKLRKQTNAKVVVEKTCANSLRVPFVDEILEESKFLFIFRDGRDATVSAAKKWQSKASLAYQLKKAKFIPIRDAPYHLGVLGRRKFKVEASGASLQPWGPYFKDLDEYLLDGRIFGAAALQWARCVESSLDALAALPADRVSIVSYEQFVKVPVATMNDVWEKLGLERFCGRCDVDTSSVSSGSVGKGTEMTDGGTKDEIQEAILPTMRRLVQLGYQEAVS